MKNISILVASAASAVALAGVASAEIKVVGETLVTTSVEGTTVSSEVVGSGTSEVIFGGIHARDGGSVDLGTGATVKTIVVDSKISSSVTGSGTSTVLFGGVSDFTSGGGFSLPF